MVIIYYIGIGKGGGKRHQRILRARDHGRNFLAKWVLVWRARERETMRPRDNECKGGVQAEWGLMGSSGESEGARDHETKRPKEKMSRERKANKATKVNKTFKSHKVQKQKLS